MTDVAGGLRREWAEEIEADFVPEFDPVGVLNDDDNSVGAVHLGLVYAAPTRAVGRWLFASATSLKAAFASYDEVEAVADRLETWSALLFDFLVARR